MKLNVIGLVKLNDIMNILVTGGNGYKGSYWFLTY